MQSQSQVQTQSHVESQSQQLLTQVNNAMVSQMFEESSQVTQINLAPRPLPDNQFVMANQPTGRPMPLTTATKEGKLRATKRKAAGDGPGKRATKKK